MITQDGQFPGTAERARDYLAKAAPVDHMPPSQLMLDLRLARTLIELLLREREPAVSAVEWNSPDDGWSWSASPGGGVLIVRPQGCTWVPAWTTSDGYILWRGDPLPTRRTAQRAAERQTGQ